MIFFLLIAYIFNDKYRRFKKKQPSFPFTSSAFLGYFFSSFLQQFTLIQVFFVLFFLNQIRLFLNKINSMSFSQLSSIFRLIMWKTYSLQNVYHTFNQKFALQTFVCLSHYYSYEVWKGPLKGAPSPHFWLNTFSLGLLSLEDSFQKVIEYSSSNCFATACMRNTH